MFLTYVLNFMAFKAFMFLYGLFNIQKNEYFQGSIKMQTRIFYKKLDFLVYHVSYKFQFWP